MNIPMRHVRDVNTSSIHQANSPEAAVNGRGTKLVRERLYACLIDRPARGML